MPRKLTIIFLWAALLLPCRAFADISVKASVDKKTLTMRQVLVYKLTVTCSGKEDFRPQLPSFDGFMVVSQEESTSVSFEAGVMKTEALYVFTLRPLKDGVISILPAKVSSASQTVISEGFSIEVGAASGELSPEEKRDNATQENTLPFQLPDNPKITI